MKAVHEQTMTEHPAYAILVLLLPDNTVILEVRAAGISQAGDPCFPGGRIEAGETALSAAIREMEEKNFI